MNQESHRTNGSIGKNTNNCNNNNNNVENSSIDSESEEDMKLFKTRPELLSDSESGHNHRHIHSHHNHSKQIRKDKFEKSSKRTTMDEVLKRLNKYNNNDEQRTADSDHNLLNSAFDLAELASSANDRRNIQETEQRLTSMIEQLQHLRQKLVNQQQVSVKQLNSDYYKIFSIVNGMRSRSQLIQ